MNDDYSSVVETIRPSPEGFGHSRLRVLGVEIVDVFAAKQNNSGLEALHVELEIDLLNDMPEWPQSEGFDLGTGPTETETLARVSLQLSDVRFREVFITLGNDIYRTLKSSSDARGAIRDLHQRLCRWQAFLKGVKPDGLSSESQVGLFGELLLLRDLFLDCVDTSTAVRSWRGCKGAVQDFQLSAFALEVKTTRQTIPEKIWISSVNQLDEEGIEYMILSIVSMDESEATGQSLPILVTDIRSRLEEPALDWFNDGLLTVGYFDAHAPQYQTLYRPSGIRHFAVCEEFPRLLRDDVPDGVRSVRYSIAIDACGPFEINEDAVRKSLHAAASGDQDG